jgi:hypothetical protein
MTESAFDLTEAIYAVGDVASDPAQAATQLRALLGQLEGQGGQQPPGTQHQAAGVGPGGSSALAPEATPFPELDPFPIGQLGERVDQVGRQVATMGEQDRQDALYSFVDQLNRSLDEAAGQRPHPLDAGDSRAPATSDEELGQLARRIDQAALDPAGHTQDQFHGLVEELNATIGHIGREHERHVDEFEARRVAAERQRQAKARTQDTTAKTLRQLAGRLDGAAAPGR